MESRRLLLFENGAAVGVFSTLEGGERGQHFSATALVLEPSGASFTHVQQDGTCLRHLSEYCKHGILPQLATLTTFRNLHSLRPYISQRLLARREADADDPRSIGYARPSQGTSGYPVTRGELRVRDDNPLRARIVHGNATMSRHYYRRRVSRVAHWPAGPDAGRHCTVHADGRVEVRALGGNARLTLSALRSLVEVDFATAALSSTTPGCISSSTAKDVNHDVGGSTTAGGREDGSCLERSAREVHSLRRPRDGVDPGQHHSPRRVWVTQRFLVYSVPEAFAPAVGVALRVGGSTVEGGLGGSNASDGAWKENIHEEGGGRGGFVSSPLPSPEETDLPRWDTVRASPTEDYGYTERSDHIGQLFAANGIDSESPSLLAVDVLKLAEGWGFAGTLAPLIEMSEECTYRIVQGSTGDDNITGQWRGVKVHVVVHADGSEVWLEGDFVRLLRPPSTVNPSPKTRILHVLATSTVRFHTCPTGSTGKPPLSSPTSKAPCSHVSDKETAPTVDHVTRNKCDHENSGGAPVPPTAEPIELSLGNITSRAQALRAHFVSWSTTHRSPRGQSLLKGDYTTTTSVVVSMNSESGGCPGNAARIGPVARVPASRGVSPGRPVDRRSRGRRAPSVATTNALAPFVDIVERAQREGASFVLFADGRARGSFVDRTIVTLPPQDCSNCEERGLKAGSPHLNVTVDNSGMDEKEETRRGAEGYGYRGVPNWRVDDIECILPDGNVVKVGSASFLSERHVENVNNDDGSNRYGWGGAGTAATAAPSCGSLSSLPARHKARSFQEKNLPHLHCLKPYVLAVRRFAEWATADPTVREAKTTLYQQNHLAALAEAEKNRRFVTLGRLQRQTTRNASHRVPQADVGDGLSTTATQGSPDCLSFLGQRTTHPEVGGCARTCAYSSAGRDRTTKLEYTYGGTGEGESPIPRHVLAEIPAHTVTPNGKPYSHSPHVCRAADKIGDSSRNLTKSAPKRQQATNATRVSPTRANGCRYRHVQGRQDDGGVTSWSVSREGVAAGEACGVQARERNEIVRRVLEANRDALLGREASRQVAMLRDMR